MGQAQGSALRAQLHALRSDLSRLEAFRLLQPRWLPYPAYRWFAEQKAARYLNRALADDGGEFSERLNGIASGAGIGMKAIALFNAMEPLLSSVGGCTACPGACSAIAVRGARSFTGEPVIARNFDYLVMVQPAHALRESRPQNGLRSIEFTTAPMAGAIDGMNENGLCITYNYAFAIDETGSPAPSISMLIGQTLSRCSTVAEAGRWISSRPRWGAGLLMLADASGDIASLELSNTRSHLRRPASGEDFVFHSNAYFGAEMKTVQAPWESIYDERAPKNLRGQRLHESSERRDQRLSELLSRGAVLGVDELAGILADHGPQNCAGDHTLCVHSPYWTTTACLQFLPKSRRVRVAFAPACQAEFQEFQL
jgi:hypothetical protein